MQKLSASCSFLKFYHSWKIPFPCQVGLSRKLEIYLKFRGSTSSVIPTDSHCSINECPRSDYTSDLVGIPSKKRKTVLRWTEQVPEHTGMDGPVDDEYSWRKYGMNYVFGARYPRSYYRCKLQRCLALKQVQRSEEDPSTFVVTYRRRHTCIQFSNRHDQLDEKRQRRSLDTVINFQTGCHVKTEESGEEKVVLKSPSLSFPSAPLPTPTLSIERDKNSSSMTTDNHSLHLTNEYKVILVFHLMDRSLLILFNYQVVLIKTVIIFLLIVEIISIRCDVQRTSLSF